MVLHGRHARLGFGLRESTSCFFAEERVPYTKQALAN
jgi:hypothetical protein